MVKPGIHVGLPMADYLAMPAVNAGLLRTLLDSCPLAAWHGSWLNPNRPAEDSTKRQDAGSISHGILLEGSTAGVAVIDPADYPAEKTGNIPDGWTNKAIRTARDEARAAGRIPVLAEQMSVITAMVASARAFLDSPELKRNEPAVWAAFQPGGGDSELTMVWDEVGTLCKIRPDRISTDRGLILDYKTGGTTAEPDAWGRGQMVKMGYYIGASLYRRGVEALCNGVSPDYVFLVQEDEPPYLCSLVGMDPRAFELGTAKVRAALEQWKRCVETNRWPAYPARVHYPEIPTWVNAQFEEQEMRRMEIDPLQLQHGVQP